MPLQHHLSAPASNLASPPTPHEQSGAGPSDVGAIADTIKRAGMAQVASLLLQTAKPLSWVGGQMLWALQPFLGSLGYSKLVSRLAETLEQQGTVDDLVERLNTPEEQGKKA